MGVSRSAERVARRSSVSALPTSRFAWVRLSGSVVVIRRLRAARPRRESKRPSSPGRKVEPSAVPPSFGDAALRDRRAVIDPPIGAALYRWRSAPEPTSRRRSVERSVRRLPGPFPAVAAPVSTSHRVSLPTLDGYSSRS